MTRDDLDYVRAEVPMLKRISPEVDKQSPVAFGTRSGTYGIHGILFQLPEDSRFGNWRRRLLGGTGRLYSQPRRRHRLDVKKKLFSGQDALGENVRIDGISYKVIGVLKHTISNGDEDMNSLVYLPYSAMSDLKNTYYLDGIFMDYEGDHEKVVKGGTRLNGFSSQLRSQR